MAELGHDALLPSIEDAPDSIWITDDDAPGGIAGYYERRRVPLRHTLNAHGRAVVLCFWYRDVEYRIQCESQPSRHENLELVVDVLRTSFQWIEAKVASWPDVFAGFARTDDSSDIWWRVLRLPPDATEAEIKAGYHRLAARVHPDAGGTADGFRRVREAYETALTIRRGS